MIHDGVIIIKEARIEFVNSIQNKMLTTVTETGNFFD